MAGPFHNAIRGVTLVVPGTGSFQPSGAAPGALPWPSAIAWAGLVRFEDGTDWELRYCFWNGLTISRPAAGFVASSTGSGLNLSANATAELVADGYRVRPDTPGVYRELIPVPGSNAPQALGMPAATGIGTATAPALASTNYLTGQNRVQYASATTANSQAGVVNTQAMAIIDTSSGRGGWKFACRYGASTLPTGPRLFVGMTAGTFASNTGEPSAFVQNYAVHGRDSTDTFIQLITNSNAGGGTKISTGISFAANGWYESVIWCDPGNFTIKALLIRWDTGEIHYTETSTDTPNNASLLFPQMIGSLNGTNTGTAITMQFGGYSVRSGG